MEKELQKIKLIALDMDGVLTDNTVEMDELGNIRKRFNYSDCIAIDKLTAYFDVILISSSDRVNPEFAEYIGIPYYHVPYGKKKNKKDFMFKFLQRCGLNWRNLLFVGDGIVDKKLLQVAALSFCPLNADPEIKRLPGIYRLKRKGGNGVVEELYELIKPEIMRRLKYDECKISQC